MWPPPPGSGNVAASLHVDRYDYTSPVGSFDPTADGLYDLAGNVCEWCDDIYEPKEHYRVLRGGSWKSPAEHCRPNARFKPRRDYEGSDAGFRLALVFEKESKPEPL